MTRPRPPACPWPQNCQCSADSRRLLPTMYLDVKISNHTRLTTLRADAGSAVILHQCRAQAKRDRCLAPAVDLDTHVGDRHASAQGSALAGFADPLDVIAEAERRRPHVVHLNRHLRPLKRLQAVEILELGLAQD